MKNMKSIVVFAFLAMVGMVGSAQAAGIGWFTTTSTAVCISTETDIEITDVFIGTGNATAGDIWAVLIDSNPIGAEAITLGALMHRVTLNEGVFPVSQWVTPPMLAVTTTTVTDKSLSMGYQNLTGPTGEGRTINNGLCLFIVKNSATSTNPGTKVTIGYRRRTSLATR